MVVVGFNLRRWVGGKGVGFVDWIGKIGLLGKREPSMAEDNIGVAQDSQFGIFDDR